ncbi:MAG: hypothetical protein PHP50_07735 [Lachnospiraceae bacterium]|nr:hypothetical protein [Lachnospiraceae bacterium]
MLAASNKRIRMKESEKAGIRGMMNCILVVFLIILGIGGLFIWDSFYTKVDLRDAVAISFSGYDGRGSADYILEGDAAQNEFWDTVSVELDHRDQLKNGDVIKVLFSYDKSVARESKLRVRGTEETIQVTGLPEATVLSVADLFQNLQVSYAGIAPNIDVELTNTSEDPYLKTINFEIENSAEVYKLNDTFTVKAVFDQTEAANAGFAIAEGSDSCIMEYTVSGVDSYLTEASQLSEDDIKHLVTISQKLFGEDTQYGLRIFSEAHLMPIWINRKTTFQWSNPVFVSAYLNTLNEDSYALQEAHFNDVKLVFRATLSQADGVSCQAEAVVCFTDLKVNADGSFDLAENTAEIISASYRDSNINDLVDNTYNTNYTSVKINSSGQ